jgi:hypothetical protein
MKKLLSLAVISVVLLGTTAAQTPRPARSISGGGAKVEERNDLIESRVSCVPINEAKLDEREFLHVTFKNDCNKDIVNFLFRYLNASQFLSVYSLKQQQERTIAIPVNGHGMERGFRIDAVLFKDGTGEGVPNKIRLLKLLYEGSQKELERIIQMIDHQLDPPPPDAKSLVDGLVKDLQTLQDDNADFKDIGLGGTLLIAGKVHYTHRIQQIAEKSGGDLEIMIDEIKKIRSEIRSILSAYPVQSQLL